MKWAFASALKNTIQKFCVFYYKNIQNRHTSDWIFLLAVSLALYRVDGNRSVNGCACRIALSVFWQVFAKTALRISELFILFYLSRNRSRRTLLSRANSKRMKKKQHCHLIAEKNSSKLFTICRSRSISSFAMCKW